MVDILRIRDRSCVRRSVIMSRYRTWFLRDQTITSTSVCIRGWMSVIDQGLSLMHGFSAKVRVILTNEWPDDFRKVGIVALTPPCRVTEGWILCFWTDYNVGRHGVTPHDGAPPGKLLCVMCGTTCIRMLQSTISSSARCFLDAISVMACSQRVSARASCFVPNVTFFIFLKRIQTWIQIKICYVLVVRFVTINDAWYSLFVVVDVKICFSVFSTAY